MPALLAHVCRTYGVRSSFEQFKDHKVFGLAEMLGDIIGAAKQHGLLLHPEKTKIMSNLTRRAGRCKGPNVDVGGMKVEILPYAGAVKYLGQMISFDEPAET